ncbi:MAG: SMP-30/gluconolactonase/LRE family protein [Flavobacteriaceae bacterium]|nr:SMP-30/gluconolactonase/LRE family protein [Flavobacteriaceae bacterium]
MKNKKAVLLYEIHAQLGEGAFWNHETGILYWVDIEGKQLHLFDPEKKTDRSFPTPSRIGTVVPQNRDTAVVALEDGIYKLNTNNGTLALLSDVEAKVTANRFNDGKCDPNGNLWVGSMDMEQKKPGAKLYKVEASGRTTIMLDNVTISNGIVWTKDKKTMYYIDTPTRKIRAFDFNPENSTISNERVAVQVSESLGYPDGMAIDENDNLWVGMWNGNSVLCFDPKTGTVIDKIDVPAHNVTSCAFGGKDLNLLYITTASVDMTDDEKKQFPLAGSLFVAEPGVKGVKSTLFK